ncbi:MAG: carboxypeptidase-like regulatory domain-containing protein, partial [Armatimonadota bacterium]
PPPERPVSILLTEGSGVTTRILDPEGNPLPGIETSVWLTPRDLGGFAGPRSDQDGNLVIAPLPAGVALRIRAPSEISHLALEEVWRQEVKLTPGIMHELPPMVFDMDGRSVSGIVQDEAGEPVAGAKVAAFRPQLPINSVLTDEDGRFTLSRLAVRGDVWILASHPTQPLYAAAKIPPQQEKALSVALRGLTRVSGQLCDRQGRPVKDADVWVLQFAQERPPLRPWSFRYLPHPARAKTDAEGLWSVEGLVSGAPYAVAPQVPGLRYDMLKLMFRASADVPVDLGKMLPLP